MKKKPKDNQKSASYEERKMTCHHEFHILVDQYDLWWCKKKEINGINWMEQDQRCVFCGGMFGVDEVYETLCRDEIPLNVKIIFNLVKKRLNIFFWSRGVLNSTLTIKSKHEVHLL